MQQVAAIPELVASVVVVVVAKRWLSLVTDGLQL